ncbi:MAG TPA: 5-(carboxyamino)imidazole ribonucleotide synthase [Actinomycetota bacterium]
MRVGVIGGGQLGRMLALAGHDLGIEVTTLDPAGDSPASQVAPAIVATYEDEGALLDLAACSDVVTFEFENVPAASSRFLADRGVPLYPPPDALAVAQDRLAEKTLFTEVGLPVPTFAAVDDLASLHAAIDAIGVPAVLKTRRLGYDGKGQARVHAHERAEDAWRAVGEVPSILEAFVSFEREVSILAARGRDGEVRAWPLVENHHRDGILRVSYAPAPDIDELRSVADAHVAAVMARLDYVGVLAIELFVAADGGLLGNEMAPRVHNSGHWTIEGSQTSQFAQHLRAVTGLPLGGTAMRGVAAMVNVIGEPIEPAGVLAVPGLTIHDYGKTPRPARKLGHMTVTADRWDDLRARVLQVVADPADA